MAHMQQWGNGIDANGMAERVRVRPRHAPGPVATEPGSRSALGNFGIQSGTGSSDKGECLPWPTGADDISTSHASIFTAATGELRELDLGVPGRSACLLVSNPSCSICWSKVGDADLLRVGVLALIAPAVSAATVPFWRAL
jgi:hypothetical protein